MSTPPPDLPPSLATRFEVRGVLGTGSYGTVVRATDRQLEREVAIKLLRADRSPNATPRFQAEAACLARVRHPGLVEVFDHGIEGGIAFLVMELLPGRTLDEQELPDPVADLLQVADALDVVHGHGVIHRDLKPSNVLWSAERGAVLIDFGLVLDPNRSQLTRTGAIVGTLASMPPEQLRGEPATPRSDWYSWGVTLYTCREGRPPFGPPVLMAVAQGADLPEPDFDAVDPASPEAHLLRAALASDPEERPGSAREVRRLLAGKRLRRSPPRPAPPRARPPWGAGLLLALGTCVAGFLLGGPPGAPAPPAPAATAAPEQAPDPRRDLESALERLLGAHRDPGGRFRSAIRDGVVDDHVPEILAEFQDARLPGLVRRFLEASVALAEEAPDEFDAWMEEEGFAAYLHLGTDRSLVNTVLQHPHGFLRPVRRAPAPRSYDPEILRARLAEVAAVHREVLPRLAPLGQRFWPGVLGIGLRAALDEPEKAAALPQGLALLGQVEDPRRRGVLALALDGLFPFTVTDARLYPCASREFGVTETARVLEEDGPEMEPWIRTCLAGSVVLRNFHFMGVCRKQLRSADLARFSRGLDVLEWHLEDDPGGAAATLESTLAMHRIGGFLLTSFGPAFDAAMARVPPLLQRSRRALGAPPDEVPLADTLMSSLELLSPGR